MPGDAALLRSLMADWATRLQRLVEANDWNPTPESLPVADLASCPVLELGRRPGLLIKERTLLRVVAMCDFLHGMSLLLAFDDAGLYSPSVLGRAAGNSSAA